MIEKQQGTRKKEERRSDDAQGRLQEGRKSLLFSHLAEFGAAVRAAQESIREKFDPSDQQWLRARKEWEQAKMRAAGGSSLALQSAPERDLQDAEQKLKTKEAAKEGDERRMMLMKRARERAAEPLCDRPSERREFLSDRGS